MARSNIASADGGVGIVVDEVGVASLCFSSIRTSHLMEEGEFVLCCSATVQGSN